VTERIDRDEEIEETAALWVARLGEGPLRAEAQAELVRWLAEDLRHRASFVEAQAAWGVMSEVAHAPGALQCGVPRAAGRLGRRWRAVAALAASLLVLVAGAMLWSTSPLVVLAADHRTAPGEQRVVALPDGSTVELGPASAIALHFDDRERRVELLGGVAYVVPAPRQGDEQRPFVMEAGEGSARALGTQFAVRRLSSSVEVVVVEHQVIVAAGGPKGEVAQVLLSPGQSVRYSDAGLGPVQNANLDQALAWRRNWLVFDRVPFAQVVDELNRYRSRRIVIVDSALSRRQVSGVFDMADPEAALATIARELGARTVSAPLVTLLY
jgi:transmembrane sensor